MKNRKKRLTYRSKTREIEIVQKYVYKDLFDDIRSIYSNVIAVTIRDDSIKITLEDLLTVTDKRIVKRIRIQHIIPRMPENYYYEIYREGKRINLIDGGENV